MRFQATLLKDVVILPIMMPLLGTFGLIYYGLVLLADLIKTLILLIIGRFILPRPDAEELKSQEAAKPKRPTVKEALSNSLRGSIKIIPRTLKTLIPFAWAAFILIGFGVFDYAAKHLGVVAHYFPVSLNISADHCSSIGKPYWSIHNGRRTAIQGNADRTGRLLLLCWLAHSYQLCPTLDIWSVFTSGSLVQLLELSW